MFFSKIFPTSVFPIPTEPVKPMMINISLFQRVAIALVCVLGALYALPNLFGGKYFEKFPEWMPGKTINLGLDLQGGLHLLLKVEPAVAIVPPRVRVGRAI